MDLTVWGTFLSAFLIGFSGAMMPGPMLGVTISGSLRKGFIAGPLVVLGHGILELLLVFAMAFGLSAFFENPTVAGLIGLIGGLFLAWMGYGMIKSGLQKTVSLSKTQSERKWEKNLVFAGVLVSITNPYFIMWWATTGIESVRQAYTLGILGVLLFFVGHILSDLTWYSAVSFAMHKGKSLMSDKVYQGLIVVLGVFLLAFAVKFAVGGWQMLF